MSIVFEIGVWDINNLTLVDNDAAKKQLEFLMGGFKLLCQSEVQFLEMLTSMEETLKRMVCAVERIESRSISDDGRQLDLRIFTKGNPKSGLR